VGAARLDQARDETVHLVKGIVVHRLNPLLGNIVAGRVKVNLSHNLTNQGDEFWGVYQSRDFLRVGVFGLLEALLEKAYPLAQGLDALVEFFDGSTTGERRLCFC